jgi:hypothetical protein
MVMSSGNANQETGNMIPTMNPETVRAAIAARGTKIATVSFVKKDGSIRTINGLFKTTSHMVGGDGGARQHDVLKANDLVAIYSLKDRGWRSFRADAVTEIK